MWKTGTWEIGMKMSGLLDATSAELRIMRFTFYDTYSRIQRSVTPYRQPYKQTKLSKITQFNIIRAIFFYRVPSTLRWYSTIEGASVSVNTLIPNYASLRAITKRTKHYKPEYDFCIFIIRYFVLSPFGYVPSARFCPVWSLSLFQSV